MVTNMELWNEVRRRVLTGELSKRQACQKFELHWDTLQKILRNVEPPGYRRRKACQKPVLGPFLAMIHEILEADKKAPPKQRHTAKRILERLREKGYRGGRTVVQEEVRRWKQRSAEVFMPLVHRPGEAQVDYGTATIVYRGQERKVAVFVMSLPYSDAVFCQIFPRECTETFQEGHRRAFEFFGGVPKRITYDNSRIAVTKLIQKRGGVFTREFLRLESHYLFEHHFSLVRRPNEKGHIESLVGYSRRNFLVPVPKLDDFDAFNESLIEDCRQELQRQVRGKHGTKAELLEEDVRAMLPLMEVREERQLTRMKGQLAKLDVLILDERGYVPASKLGSELLFDVISTAYERTSVIVTTNLPFEQWTEVLGSERLTGAVLDRLTHRRHILEATGESFRLKDARRRSPGKKSSENDESNPTD